MLDIEKIKLDFNESNLLKSPKNQSTKRIFIAATKMNDGKTTTSLGLYSALNDSKKSIGFIKPIGQRSVDINGQKIDEDSFLFNETFNVKTPIEAMSPIVIYKNFTKQFLEDPDLIQPKLIDFLCKSFDRAAYEKDYIIIEGTGHAGVGSIFNLSNAKVAKTLKAKVIMVSSGGIGSPIDQISLNQALFAKEGVDIIGVIINKVNPEKIDYIKHYCEIALNRMGLKLLGCIPENKNLSVPNFPQVINQIKGNWINKKDSLEIRKISKIIIGAKAKAAKSIIENIGRETLLITSFDRDDIIKSLIKLNRSNLSELISGVIFTNYYEDEKIIKKLKALNVPIAFSKEDSFSVTTRINKMTIKTQPYDNIKIPIIKEMVKKHINLEEIQYAFN